MRSAKERINEIKGEIRELSHAIHEEPELGLEEFHAVERQAKLLSEHGFTVERKVCGLETAFVASYKGEKPGPAIGFLAEYDALKGMGHACGHNMIAALASACGIAMKEAVDEYGGEVRVIGTPAEETLGGKVNLAEAGRYDDLAAAMMAHPFGRHAASGTMNALDSQRFEFFGKASHAADAPEAGINALSACIELFNMVNALRLHITPDARISGVIRNGGVVGNIVPDYAMAEFYIRANTSPYLLSLRKRVLDIANAAALGTGARVEITNFEGWYDDLHTNETLSERAVLHTKECGVTQDMAPYYSTASSDIGNVSYRCPTVHQWFDVSGDPEVNLHTEALRECADSDYGYEQLFIVAEAFCLTAEDLLRDTSFREKVKKEFDDFKAAQKH